MSETSKIKCAIFDMDGTIVDVPYNWDQIKRELDTQGRPILDYLEGLKEPERSEKMNILIKYESEATRKAELKKGMAGFIRFIKGKGVLVSLVTNNSRKNVFYLLKKFNLEFDLVITRESGLWKPSAEPLLEVFDRLSLTKEECCMIGDSRFDIIAAREAGMKTIFIINKDVKKFKDEGIEVYASVRELKNRMIRMIA
ncbi:MAG: HAD family phosphatase [Candidatus Aminicenantes bacterium]|nr:HAD family phosphatase [Candidatus Aminicenantes bacterium]